MLIVFLNSTPCKHFSETESKFQNFLSRKCLWKNVIYKMSAILSQPQHVSSLAPGKFEWKFRYGIFKWILVIDGWGISCEIAIIWMSLYLTDDQSTLVQVMAWCRQATSHYLSQCWPRSLPPYGVTIGHNELSLPSLFLPFVSSPCMM